VGLGLPAGALDEVDWLRDKLEKLKDALMSGSLDRGLLAELDGSDALDAEASAEPTAGGTSAGVMAQPPTELAAALDGSEQPQAQKVQVLQEELQLQHGGDMEGQAAGAPPLASRLAAAALSASAAADAAAAAVEAASAVLALTAEAAQQGGSAAQGAPAGRAPEQAARPESVSTAGAGAVHTQQPADSADRASGVACELPEAAGSTGHRAGSGVTVTVSLAGQESTKPSAAASMQAAAQVVAG
jgi:hypothetical protein